MGPFGGVGGHMEGGGWRQIGGHMEGGGRGREGEVELGREGGSQLRLHLRRGDKELVLLELLGVLEQAGLLGQHQQLLLLLLMLQQQLLHAGEGGGDLGRREEAVQQHVGHIGRID